MTRRDAPRVVEFELNLFSLALGAAVLLALLGGAFLLGRAAVSPAPALSSAGRGPAPGVGGNAGGGGVEPIGSATIFDDAGDEEKNRAPQFQMTREASRSGRFALEIGKASTRVVAGKLEEAARSAGVPAAVVADGKGGYLVTGGPYATRAEADRAGARLGTLLGRPVPVREAGARP